MIHIYHYMSVSINVLPHKPKPHILYMCIPVFLHQHKCTWAAGISTSVSRTDLPRLLDVIRVHTYNPPKPNGGDLRAFVGAGAEWGLLGVVKVHIQPVELRRAFCGRVWSWGLARKVRGASGGGPGRLFPAILSLAPAWPSHSENARDWPDGVFFVQ